MLFADLPLEILPEILAHIVKPQHLALICLVNTTFQTFATPRLYERISIYSWHREGKIKVSEKQGRVSVVPTNLIIPSERVDRSSNSSRHYLNMLIWLDSCRNWVCIIHSAKPYTSC